MFPTKRWDWKQNNTSLKLIACNDKQLSISCSVNRSLLGTGIVDVEFRQKLSPTQNSFFTLYNLCDGLEARRAIQGQHG